MVDDTPDSTPTGGAPAMRPLPADRLSIADLIRSGTLDAELAATLWLLVEARVPLVVAAADHRSGKSTVLAALLDFAPSGTRLVGLAGADETFEWLPQATDLGWPGVARPGPGPQVVRPDTTILLADELSDHHPNDTWGAAARVAVRAASIGYGLAATMHADSLDGVFETLRRPPVRLSDDELSHLGVVLVLRRVDDDRRRLVAAHFVRPIARDPHGHIQRLGPAVLATWDPSTDSFEHFGWGITPELAMRVGRRAGDFEIEVGRRQAHLDALVASGLAGGDTAQSAIAAYRPAAAPDAPRDGA